MDRSSLKYPINRKTVEQLSWAKSEPAWMTQIRLDAWDRYESLPAPEGLSGLDFSQFEGYVDPPRQAAPWQEWPEDLQHTLNERGDEEGLIVQRDATILSKSITKDSVKRNVVFTDLDTALKIVPDLVKRYFPGPSVPDDKLAALRTAFWSGGCFLYVPEFVEVDLPFHMCYWLSTPNYALFPQLVLVAERGSRVYIMDEYLSSKLNGRNVALSSARFHVAERARVHHFHMENWGEGVTHLAQQGTNVESGGSLYRWSAEMSAKAERIRLSLQSIAGDMQTTETATAESLDERFLKDLIDQGISSSEAEYSAASRFFDPLLHRLPDEPLREKIRHYLVGKVTGRRKEVTLQRAAELHPEIRH